MSDHDTIRRIAERGLSLAQKCGPQFIDTFQHLLDEIERCDILPKERACKTCRELRRDANRYRYVRRVQPVVTYDLDGIADMRVDHPMGHLSVEYDENIDRNIDEHRKRSNESIPTGNHGDGVGVGACNPRRDVRPIIGMGSPIMARPDSNDDDGERVMTACPKCNGAGGWEACSSSTEYFWKTCPQCKGLVK